MYISIQTLRSAFMGLDEFQPSAFAGEGRMLAKDLVKNEETWTLPRLPIFQSSTAEFFALAPLVFTA